MSKPAPVSSRGSFAAIALLLIAALASLAWVYKVRLADFHSYHSNFAAGASAEIASQFSALLRERQRQVGLFSEDHQGLLERMVRDPENVRLHEEISRRLRRSFPDHFAFVIANQFGEPYWKDFDGYVGEVCVQDIQKFAHAGRNAIRLHPNPVEYHYDVMAHWSSSDKLERILMVSFKPDQLVEKLRAVKVPGHDFMLIRAQGSHLIEVTAKGARTALDRTDFRLTADELARLVHRRDVPGSDWQLVDVFEPGFVENHRRELLADISVFMLVFLGVATVSVLLIRRQELARRSAEQAREEMISTVTHELRTPLTSLVGSLGLLANGALGNLPEKAQELINVMNRSAEGLRRLIDDLLDVRRIEAGNLRLEMQTIELGALVDEALLRNMVYAKGLDVRFERIPQDAPVWVSVDPLRLHQVMANLLSNAAKYAPTGSAVTVAVKSLNGGLVRVSVSDCGPGISDAFRSRIFRRFSQDAAAASKGMSSSGLGLCIVKTLMEMQGGAVGFDSTHGEGSSFHFDLPVVPPPSGSAGVVA